MGGFIYDYLINHTFNEQSILGIVLWIVLVTSQEKNSFNDQEIIITRRMHCTSLKIL